MGFSVSLRQRNLCIPADESSCFSVTLMENSSCMSLYFKFSSSNSQEVPYTIWSQTNPKQGTETGMRNWKNCHSYGQNENINLWNLCTNSNLSVFWCCPTPVLGNFVYNACFCYKKYVLQHLEYLTVLCLHTVLMKKTFSKPAYAIAF